MVFRNRVDEPCEGLFQALKALIDQLVHNRARLQRTKKMVSDCVLQQPPQLRDGRVASMNNDGTAAHISGVESEGRLEAKVGRTAAV